MTTCAFGLGSAGPRAIALVLLLLVTSMSVSVAAQPASPPGKAAPAGGARAPKAQPPGPAAKQTFVAAYTAFRSLDALEELSDRVGLPLPPLLTASGLEQQLPFLGAGGLAKDEPIGMIFFGGPGVTQQTAGAFVLPMKEGRAELDLFKQRGARPVPGKADAVQMGGGAFRRTDKYLILGPNLQGVVALDPALVPGAVKDEGALARLSMDLAAMKRLMPEQYDAFFEEHGMAEVGANPGEQAGARLALGFLKALDRVTIGVDRGAAGVRVRATLAPMSMPAPTQGVLRPGMPSGVVARFDLACPPTKAVPPLAPESFRALIDESSGERLGNNQRQRGQSLDLIVRASQVLVGSDATSVGVQPPGGADASPVFHVVNQYTRPVDVVKEVREIVQGINGVAREAGYPAPQMEVGEYESGGTTITRVTLLERGRPMLFVDVVQRGRVTYVSIGPSEKTSIDALVAAKPEAEAVKGQGGGGVDLGRLLEVVARFPDGPLAGMPEEQSARLRERLRGQKVVISAAGEGGGVTFEASLPDAVLKAVGETAVTGSERPQETRPPLRRAPK
jgi:hypothetical protein